MEQYLLQVPKRLATEVRKSIGNRETNKIELVSSADNKHFTFLINNKEYPTKIVQLPCILETHKTYDDNLFYKSGEIGQAFVVTENGEDKQALEEVEEVPSGITPPNTNVVKRKYEKTKRYTPFPKPDVSRVEEDLVKVIAGNGPVEDVQEELVDFYDWMVDGSNPNKGIVVTDEIELIRQHPEYLTLTKEEPKDENDDPNKKRDKGQAKQANGAPGTMQQSSSTKTSTVNTPQITDTDAESQSGGMFGGQESAQRSPMEIPTPSPNMSAEEKDVDDLEEELLGDMELTTSSSSAPKTAPMSGPKRTTVPMRATPSGSPPTASSTPAPSPPPKAREEDPAYQKLVATKEQLEKKLVEFDREVYDLRVKVETSSNIIVKNRFKQQLDNAESQRNSIAKELQEAKDQIIRFTVQ